MKKWHMVIDVAKCHDCNNCFLACKDEYVDNDWPGYSVSQPKQGHLEVDLKKSLNVGVSVVRGTFYRVP